MMLRFAAEGGSTFSATDNAGHRVLFVKGASRTLTLRALAAAIAQSGAMGDGSEVQAANGTDAVLGYSPIFLPRNPPASVAELLVFR